MRRTTLALLGLGLIGLAGYGFSRLDGSAAVPTVMAVEPERDAGRVEPLEAALPQLQVATDTGIAGRDELVPEKAPPVVQRATVEIQLLGLPHPAAGALVIPDRRFYARRPVEPDAEQDQPLETEFTTDHDGKLVLEVSPSTQSTLDFTWAESRWRQQITWRSPRHGKTEVLKVRFPLSPHDLEVQVRSFPSGAAIEGAGVRVGSASTYTLPKSGKTLLSDRVGVAHIPLVSGPTKDPYKVSVTAEGHSPHSFVHDGEEHGAPLTAWLAQHAKLSGVVALTESDPNEKPQASATVYLVPRDALQDPKQIELPKDGKLDFDSIVHSVAEGVAFDRLRIREEAYVAVTGEWEMKEIQFANRDERLQDYVLVVTSEMRGRILAEDLVVRPGDDYTIDDVVLRGPKLELAFTLADGTPARRAGLVTLVPASDLDGGSPSWKTQVRALVSPEGTASVPSLPEGTWQWTLSAPGSQWSPRSPVSATGTLEHSAEHSLPHPLSLESCAAVTGRIEGKPTVPVRIYWRYADAPDNAFGMVLDHGDRLFRVPLVTPGRTIDLIAIHKPGYPYYTGQPAKGPDWGPETVTVEVDEDGVSDVVLKLVHVKSDSDAFQRAK